MGRTSLVLVGALLAAGIFSAGCKKSSPSTRFDVSIVVDPALQLDAVHVVAVSAGKSPLEKDFAPAANLQWTVLIPNPGATFTASFVASGLAGAATVVTYAASASVGASKSVAVLLRLDAACANVTCGDPTQTCAQGMCVTQPTFGGGVDGGVSTGGAGPGGEGGAAAGPGGQGGGGVTVGTGGAGGMSVDAGLPDASVDSAAPTVCSPGTHMCPGGCVPNDDARTCGTSCTPCQAPVDGTATCDGMSCGGVCPTGKKLCLGACIDSAASCGGACPEQQHACNGLCPAVTDVKACGTSCLPCPVPTGATQATCDGASCDFQCMTGTHKCGATCASDTDVASCGATCTVCSTDPNGTARCVGGVCGIACAVGYHTCGGRCVSNGAVTSCGTTSCSECAAPTGGGVTCDGTMCVPNCPSGKKLCAGACIDTAAACNNTCPSGTHDCAGICASNASVDSCGTTSCASCPKPTGADATMCKNGTACDFTCGSGYHRCGAGCAADNDATACGASCTSCPTDPNGVPACVLGVCGLMCKSGFHVCNGKCVDNKAVATCGPTDNTSCNACQAPSGGGTVSCDGLACVPACPGTSKLCNGACIANTMACNGMCPNGTHNCSGICQADDSTSYCGTGCNSCNAPPSNGTAVCTGSPGTCGVKCNNGFKNCPGTNLCVPTGGCCGDSECTSPPGPNMVGACLSASCSYSCGSNFRLCGAVCIPKTGSCCSNAECTSPQTCGSNNVCSCTSQSMTTTCTGKCGNVTDNCGVTVPCGGCGTGQLCGADNKCASCGAIGQACCTGSTCTGTGSVCGGGTCQCQANYHVCNGACASNTSVMSCGPTSCAACPTTTNGTTTCGGTGPSCGITCNSGYMSCTSSGACIVDHWDMEDGTNHGFSGPTANALVHFNGTVVHGGAFSLEIDPNGGAVTSGFALFGVSFPITAQGDCPSSSDSVNREGKTLSGWLYLVNPPASSTVTIYANSTSRGSVAVTAFAAVNGWSSFSQVTTNVGTVDSFSAIITMPSGSSYPNPIYIDDLAWR